MNKLISFALVIIMMFGMLAAFISWTDQPVYQLDSISGECVQVYTLDQEGNKMYEECPAEMPQRFDSEYVDSEFNSSRSAFYGDRFM